MTLFQNIVEILTFRALKRQNASTATSRNYRHLSFILFASMFLISQGPVLVTATLSYFNYQDLLQKEERGQLEWRLDGSTQAITAMVENLKSVVLFVARDDRYKELTTGNNLELLCLRLKRQYPFFADLGVISETGVQENYFGPYNLLNADYSKELWLKEVLDKGLFISHVYLGYRQVPHFAIAVSNIDPNSHKKWVLRATIDATTLQKIVETIKTMATDDLFIVDDQGILQTPSEKYGPTLSRYPISDGITFDRQQLSQQPGNQFHAISQIKGTPWSLVLIEKRYVHHEDWITFRDRLIAIVFACMVISFIVVYTLVSVLTNLIRRADEIQMGLVQDAEHTDRLASIGRLAAGVGHEINNPLAIINQKTGLIEDLLSITGDFEYKETIADCLKSINQSVNRCKAITHRLLGFARRSDVKAVKLQVNDILREVLTFLENSMMHNRITSDLQLMENLPEVFSDHLQIQQVFLNIINNAIDAIGKDGTISILTHVVAGEVRVVIQDTGSGIPNEILPHIFEPFFTTKETGKGTGLGLSITYGLIKKLGGDITVRSHVGQGTAFTITIPIQSEQDDAK